jgi:hypothetical protein
MEKNTQIHFTNQGKVIPERNKACYTSYHIGL